MKRPSRLSRRLALLAVATLAIASCVPTPAATPPVGPDAATPSGPPLPPAMPVTSAVLGPQGGTLAASGFELTAPAGAMRTSQSLSLGRREGGTSLEGQRSAPVWVLGVPAGGFAAPVTLTLEAAASRGGKRYVLIEGLTWISGHGADRAPLLLPAEELGGRVRVTLPAAAAGAYRLAQAAFGWGPPPLPAPGATSGPIAGVPQPAVAGGSTDIRGGAPGTIDISVIDAMDETRSPAGRFTIVHPVKAHAAAGEVGFALDAAFQEYAALGVGWGSRTTWPVQVQLVAFPAGSATRDAEACAGDWHLGLMGANHHYLRVNLTRMTADRAPHFKAIVGHELMHLAQAGHDPRWAPLQKADALMTPAWLWLDEALATWFEARLLPAGEVPTSVRPDPSSANQSDNYAFLLKRGLDFSAGGDQAARQEHGYGASMFLTWLTANAVTPQAVAGLLARKGAGDTPRQALDSLEAAEVLEGRWGHFVGDWLGGGIYPGVSMPDRGTILGSNQDRDKEFVVETGLEAPRRFTWQPEPLSARLYSVRFAKSASWAKPWPANTPLIVQLAGAGPKISGYVQRAEGSVTGSAPRFERVGTLSAGSPSLTLPDGDVLAARKGALLVLLAAPAGQAEALTLTVGRPTLTFATDWSLSQGVIGRPYTFDVNATLVPGDATYTWRFGDLPAMAGKEVEPTFTEAGTYPVSVEARWPGGQASAETSFTIAADTKPAAQVEVTFDVFRKLTVRIGESSVTNRQRCNNYTLRITDAAGTYVGGGESIARNGQFELKLPPGSYKYEVNYVYTQPAARGTLGGSFQVTPDPSGLFFVPVETPGANG